MEEQITGTKAVILNMDMQIQEWANQNEGPHKILLMGESGQIDKIEPVLKKITFNRPNIYKPKPTYLEIMSDPASKTLAIIFLLTKYGLTNKDVLAIGDNYNDIEMLRFAGMGIAMGNAPDQVKAHAKYITLDNDSDGVKFALDAFIKKATVISAVQIKDVLPILQLRLYTLKPRVKLARYLHIVSIPY